jgi:predicted transcriptional regulator of viral defense system
VSKSKQRGALSAQVATVLAGLSAEGKTFFSVNDFAAGMGRGKVRASKLLHQLQESGWVARITRGIYLIVPLEAGPESAWSEDSLVVAGYLAKQAAVAYWSACHHWNWTEQVPRTVFVQTPRRARAKTRKVMGVAYRFVHVQPNKFFGTTDRSVGQGQFTVTDREKTLVDALDHPELCGGIRQVIEMLPTAAQVVNWERVEEYLKRLGSGAAYKRLGLLVEYLGEKVRIPGRAERNERWRSLLTGGYAPLEPHRPMTGPASARWRVRLNVPGLAGRADETWNAKG